MSGNRNVSELPSVGKTIDKRANVDYLYYSDQEEDEDNDKKSVNAMQQNRSQSMNNLLQNSQEMSTMKIYARWNESNIMAKQLAVRMLSKIAQNDEIKPKVTAFKESLLN